MIDTSKLSMLSRRGIKVIPEEAGLYPSDDLPAYIEKLEKRMQKKPRVRRTDLVKGCIVVVLEGDFTARRVVFLKQVENNKALCCGPAPINNVPFFVIDERYLLRTSTVLDLKEDVNIDISTVFESKRGVVADRMDIDANSDQKRIENAIVDAVSSIRFMKRYLATPFKMPKFKSVSSLKF
uniref:eL6 n=1 Tax=Paranosema locustae TaxID=235221 RepID=UPI00187D6E0D|nr:Chain LE0, eL6 [Paranosema locustae]|eukprot:jgi/Antlo1/2311/587